MQNLVREPLHLADARRVWLRPLSFEDDPQLVDLCRRTSPEYRCRRFLRPTVPYDVREAERLASVDQDGARCSAQSECSSDRIAPDNMLSHVQATELV